MAEGRIQMLTHHTEDAVWQKRWLAHPNGVRELIDVAIAVSSVAEADSRFARFLNRTSVATNWNAAGADAPRCSVGGQKAPHADDWTQCAPQRPAPPTPRSCIDQPKALWLATCTNRIRVPDGYVFLLLRGERTFSR